MKFFCLLLTVLLVQSAEAQTWVKKVSSAQTVLGDALCANPLKPSTVYGAPGGRQLYISRNRGYTWQKYGDTLPFVGATRNVDNVIKSIAVNPNDTMQILVGVESNNEVFDRVMKTTDGGQTWTRTWGGTFSYYGKPVEFKPAHPDTVYTMGNDTLWRSTNFGSTWDTVRRTTGLFANWCDAEIRPDSANIILLGDYHSGIWKTTDHGISWRLVYSTNGEIPSIAIDPFNPRTAYASNFGGSTTLLKTTNGGEGWFALTTPVTCTAGWWVTCSQTNPGYVYFGVYGCTPGAVFVSVDGGSSWRTINAGLDEVGKINYGLLVTDSLSVLALQYNGIWRLNYPSSVHVASPNGGEQFQGGGTQTILWSASNIYGVKLEYTTNGGSTWTKIADSIDVVPPSYDWTLPDLISTQCLVRISDAYYTSAADTSDSTFMIFVDPLTLFAPTGGESWDVNSTHFITWNSHAIDSVELDYSIDSGSTWIEIGRVRASTQAFPWMIPNTPSELCKIRIRNVADTSVSRTCQSVFGIHSTVFFTGTLFFKDNGLLEDSLVFGTKVGATDGLDVSLGESALPPKPGQGGIDIRWKLADDTDSKTDFRDTLGETHRTNRYVLEFQPGAGGYPVTFSWKPDSMRVQLYILRDTLTHGAKVNIDMRHDSVVSIADTSIASLEIIQCLGRKITYQASVDEWTLLSIPVLEGDGRRSFLFPLSGSRAFSYSGTYVGKDSLETGIGYWMKIPPTDLLGCDCTLDTIPVKPGWNIVGSISSAVAASSVLASSDSLIGSPFFSYDGSYGMADSVRPGSGYWLKASAQGWIALAQEGPPVLKSTRAKRPNLAQLSTLRVSDPYGNRQSLYFGEELPDVDEHYFDLPPAMPGSLFDACFTPGRLVATHPRIFENSLDYTIRIESPNREIIFSWDVDNEENFTYILNKKDGNRVVREVPMTGHGSCALIRSDKSIFSVSVQHKHGSTEPPQFFSLGEMYPNPFNPTTHVRYNVPSDAYVTVTVFSILGEEVARLVDDELHAGEYEVEWNGTSRGGVTVGSGVYFVRMHAAGRSEKFQPYDFDAVRSVVFLK